jgi:hypothetical protein
VLGLLGLVPASLTLAAAIATAAVLLWWLVAYPAMRVSPLYAFTYPLGACVLLWIVVQAVVRGQRVQWKGRAYVSATG